MGDILKMDLEKVKAFFAERKVSLPSPPAVVVRLLEQIKREDYHRLAETLRLDPALAARVLGVANSPLYRTGPEEVVSLEKAISLLGTEVVKNLALSFVIYRDLRARAASGPGFKMELFWKRSVTHAVGSRLLAQKSSLEEEHLFTAGLLADIGVLVLYQAIPERYQELLEEKEICGRSLHLLEKERLGFSHAEAGAYLLQRWGLPDHLVMDIAYHHCWERAPQAYQKDARILFLATILGGIYFSRCTTSHYEAALQELEKAFRFSEEKSLELIDRVAEEVRDLLRFFDLAPEALPPYSQILEEAREELEKLSLNCALLLRRLEEEKGHAEELARRLQEANRKLRELSIRDGLTGLYNHRYFQERLRQEWERAKRYRRPLSLILMDIDHFKRINDTYGHPVGDQILKALSRLIRENIRASDIPARYGGEEFAVILPEADLQGAAGVGERLRAQVAEAPFKVNGREIPVTISLGVASSLPGSGPFSPQKLIEAADKALYYSKTHGRNRLTAVPLD